MTMKKEKGITLVTLIITIVLLIIIATVTITSMEDDKIIDKTKESVSKYNQEAAEYDLKMAITQCYSLYGNLEKIGDFLDSSIWNYENGIATTIDGKFSFSITEEGEVTKIY